MDLHHRAPRLPMLDALRGLAIVWMVLFHLAYDLNHFGWLQPRQQFLSDPFWTWQRVCIVSLFMFCAGASQSLALRAGVPWARFWRRWFQVVACAAMVSVATWFVFPQSWISFGVLHGLALMVLLARLTARRSLPVLLGLALAALAAPWFVQHPVFDSRWLNGVGLVTAKPVTEDYAPLLPWMGMVWLGLAFGPWLERLSFTDNRLTAALAHAGQWPLSIYMLHQPLFWGLLLGLTWLRS
ncbi:MAG: heparan-alpha-glucosaminide N-acetyltransferase [Burkholderiaceae bacterium]